MLAGFETGGALVRTPRRRSARAALAILYRPPAGAGMFETGAARRRAAILGAPSERSPPRAGHALPGAGAAGWSGEILAGPGRPVSAPGWPSLDVGEVRGRPGRPGHCRGAGGPRWPSSGRFETGAGRGRAGGPGWSGAAGPGDPVLDNRRAGPGWRWSMLYRAGRRRGGLVRTLPDVGLGRAVRAGRLRGGRGR